MKTSTRREFIKKTISGAVAGTVVGSAVSQANPIRVFNKENSSSAIGNLKRNTKPNLLYIFCDQLRYGALGLNGNKVVRTPNLDKLGEHGIVFDHAFSCTPICSPYRGQIITGRYAHKNGVVCNEYKLHSNQTTIFQALKQAGYQTAYIGKWHLGYGPYTKEKRYGLDYMFAHNCDHRYYSVEYYENERGPVKPHAWAPEIETSKAIDFIDEHFSGKQGRPFSLFVGYGPPHNGYGSQEHGHYDLYPGEYNIYDPAQVDLSPNVPTPLAPYARYEMADYYANITGLDAQVGRLLKKLEELGVAENTIVCFSSDHGDHLRSYGYGGPWDGWLHHTKRANKATPHEEAIHVPFILRYPEAAKNGERIKTLFSSVDVMPTLLSLCGVEIPDGVQGKDLSHIVTGEKGEEPDSVFLQILGTGWPHRGKWVGFWRGVRTQRWTYARWHEQEKYEHGIWLYDRDKDPFEMNNLAGKPEYKEIQAKLEKRLQQWMQETDDPFDYGEREPETGMLRLGQDFTHQKYYR